MRPEFRQQQTALWNPNCFRRRVTTLTLLKAKQAPKSNHKINSVELPTARPSGKCWNVSSSTALLTACPPTAPTLHRQNPTPVACSRLESQPTCYRRPVSLAAAVLEAWEQPAGKGAAPSRQFLSEPVRVSGLLA